METVAVVIGVLVVAVAFIGFLRSLWRPLRERGSGRGDSDVGIVADGGGDHGGGDSRGHWLLS